MAFRLSSSAALFAASGCLASPALAQPAPASSSASQGKARADALIEQGVALRRRGHEREALERFRRAYQLHPSPRALGQMGLAAKSLRLYVASEQYLDGALSVADDPWVNRNRKALEQARELVAKNVASIRITSNAPHAKLLVNGSLAGELPMTQPLRVPAGLLHLELRAPGYKSKSLDRTAIAGRLDEFRIVLAPASRRATASAAQPRVQSRREPSDREAESGSSRSTWTLVAGGVGLAGVALGTYMGVHALDLAKQRDKVCPDPVCPTAHGVELDRDARSAAVWSDVGFGVGIAGLGVAAVLWFTKPAASQSRADVVLRMDSHGAYAGMRYPL